MTLFAVSTAVQVLAIIGLVVGLVVLLVVIFLLNGVLAPLRAVLNDLRDAHTAPMLERGVPGTEQLGQTRRLADSVPPLALAYLQKLSLVPGPGQAAAPAPPPQSSKELFPPTQAPSNLPAWKRYS